MLAKGRFLPLAVERDIALLVTKLFKEDTAIDSRLSANYNKLVSRGGASA